MGDSFDIDPIVIRNPRAARGGAGGCAGGGIVPRSSGDRGHAAKLERDELPKPRALSPSSRAALVTARLAAKLTQDALNVRASLPPHAVRGFESGARVPTPTELTKLNRALGTSLHYATT